MHVYVPPFVTSCKHTYASILFAKTLEIKSQTSGKHAQTNVIFTRTLTFLHVTSSFSYVSVVLTFRKHMKIIGCVAFSAVNACLVSTDVHTFNTHAFTMLRARVYYTCHSQRKGDFSTRTRVSSCGSISSKVTIASVKHTQTTPFMRKRQ
jgi:hypothetical protein